MVVPWRHSYYDTIILVAAYTRVAVHCLPFVRIRFLVLNLLRCIYTVRWHHDMISYCSTMYCWLIIILRVLGSSTGRTLVEATAQAPTEARAVLL